MAQGTKRKAGMRLVSPTYVKKFTLEYAEKTRSKKFTRVGSSVVDFAEACARKGCKHVVDTHPSVGKTIQAPTVDMG